MKILFNDIIQYSDAPKELKSPALSDTYTTDKPIVINFDKPHLINSIGIGNSNEKLTAVFDDGAEYNFDYDRNGLYVMNKTIKTSKIKISEFTERSELLKDAYRYWSFDDIDGNTILDISKNNGHIQMQQGIYLVPGAIGQGLRFESGFIQTDVPGTIFSGNYADNINYTISFWFSASDVIGQKYLFNAGGWSLRIGNSSLRISNYGYIYNISTIENNKKYHVLIKKKGDLWTWKINGIVRLGGFDAATVSVRNLEIGSVGIELLDEVAIFNRATTDAEDEILFTSSLRHGKLSIGRIAAGIACNIPTAVAKEPSLISTSEPRVTLSGQVIAGTGGYNYRAISLDSRYKITKEIMQEIEAGSKYIGMGYPFFIDLTDESYKLTFDKLYANERNQRSMTFQSGVHRFLYSRRFEFEERF